MVGIINYGLGNLGSIQNMLRTIGVRSIITNKTEDLFACDHLILPGVGAFDAGMNKLNEVGLIAPIKKLAIQEKKPILGICLGMQMLGRKSEEGNLKGLELIPFDNIKFKFSNNNLKIPHMGWDVVDFKQDNNLIRGISTTQRYYFVHSYHALCDDPSNVLMTCDYGYNFAAAVVKNNIYGVQFHPEKSHDFGMRLLKNFVEEC